MKPTTGEWIAKAEGDFAVMERESDVVVCPNYDAVCFHAQQCAEKYIKARLCEADVVFGKTHDLVALLDMVLPLEPDWEESRKDLGYLADFAVNYRYPGDTADRSAAQDAQRRCRAFRGVARQAFGLPL